MTNIHKLLLGIAGVALVMSSCTKQDSAFVPGEKEAEGCQGVYFPAQEVGGAYEPDAVNNYPFSIVVSRADDKQAITVPVEITGSGKELINLPPISFAAGQKEVTVNGEISNKAEAGTEYDAIIAITDNQYASIYSSKPSYIKFDFVVEKWNYLGEGTFWDLWIASDGYPVQVYQNDGDASRFRLVDPYKALWEDNAAAYLAGGWQLSPYAEKIDFTVYSAGETVVSNTGYETDVEEDGAIYYSAIQMGLHHPSYGADIYNINPADFSSLAGDPSIFVWNKVSTWQDNGLPSVVYMSGQRYMYGVGGWGGYDSGDEAIVVLFPGGAFTDYTLELEVGTSVEGKLPITFKTGGDVSLVGYTIYSGQLSAGEIGAVKNNIANGSEEFVVPLIPDSTGITQVDIELDSTGIYTIVAVSFDSKFERKSDADANFGYVKAGDEEKVQIVAGASLNQLPESYIAAGYSETNSLLVNVWGQDVVKAGFDVISKADYEEDSLGLCWDDLYELDEDELSELNTVAGFSGVWGGLKANTEYVLLYAVFNGYVTKQYVVECSTPGLPRVKLYYGMFTYNFWWEGDDINKFVYDPNTGLFIIENWGSGVDYAFTVNADSTVTNELTYASTNATYGPVYTVDAAQYWKGDEERAALKGYDIRPSYYDADSLTFYLNNEYFVSAGTFGRGWETFSYYADELPESVSAKNGVSRNNSTMSLNPFRSNVRVPFSADPYVRVEGERVIKAAKFNVVSVEGKAREKKDHLNGSISTVN